MSKEGAYKFGDERGPAWQRQAGRRVLTSAEANFLAAYEQVKLLLSGIEDQAEWKEVIDDPQIAHLEACMEERRRELIRQRDRELLANVDTRFVERIARRRIGGRAPKKLFDEVPRVDGDRVVLDRVVDGDALRLQELANNDSAYRYEPTFLFERQHEDAHETISLLYGDLFTQKESLILAIRMKETGCFLGLAEFYGLRDELHKVSIGYRLLQRYWGHGFATEAATLMVDYLYGSTDIELITASTMVGNVASSRVLEKSGFICASHDSQEDWGYPEPTAVDKWFC